MIIQKLKCLIYTTLLPLSLFSQVKITGKIQDNSNNAIETAEVQLLNKENKILKNSFTDQNGSFTIITENGEYLLQIRQLGTVLYDKEFFLDNNIDLGTITLETSKKLEEIRIVNKKKLIEQKIDRIVFNVGNSVSASGKDVYSALMVTPGVRVTESSISIVGKSTVMVMIEDQVVNLSGNDLTNFLKSISADDISKFEIITSPPAKYEAQGNSGIINIKYKRNKKDSWNSTIRNSFTKTTFETYSIGGSFNYQKNKISLNSNANYYSGSKLITDTNSIRFSDQNWSGNQPRKVNYDPLASFRVGLDYKISPKTNIGILYLAGVNKLNIENNKNEIEVNFIQPNLQDYKIITNSISTEKTPTNSINIHSDIALDTIGKKIVFNTDYFTYDNTINRSFDYGSYLNNNLITNTYSSSSNSGVQKIRNYTIKVDVDFPVKWANISYGGKISFIKSVNDLLFYDYLNGNYVLNTSQSNMFEYKEATQALYGSITKSLKKWDLQLGLRFENTQNKGLSLNLNEQNENKYFKVFPTLYVTYKYQNENSISLNYSRRIERPQFEFLNPFRIVQNSYNYVEGNPFLQPSYADNIEFLLLINQKWSNKIYFSKISNGFQQIAIIDPVTNIQQIKPLNYYNSNKIGWNDSYTFNKIKWWESINEIDINYTESKSLVAFTNPNLSGWNYNISTTNHFTLNSKKTFSLGVNYWHSFPGVFDIYKITSSSSLDLSFSCLFFNKSLSANLYANDVFSGQRATASGFSNQTEVMFRNYYDSRNFKISIAYKFGNKKISVQQRDFGNDDEKNRVKN